MLLALLFSVVVAVAQAVREPLQNTTAYNYHELIGIAEAQRIKEAEAALDFDASKIDGPSLEDQPHLAGLIINLLDGRQSVCGASLLSHTLVVTAAHCWFDGINRASNVVVVLGSRTLFSGGTRLTTSHVRLHEHWSWKPTRNDVALITFPHVEYTKTIRPIAITYEENQFVGVRATAAGYKSDSQSASGTRSQVTLQVIDVEECALEFGRLVRGSTICTRGSPTVGVCNGYSGGPLAMGSGDNRVLIGVASFDSRRCEAGRPTAYSRITAFYSWIQARLP